MNRGDNSRLLKELNFNGAANICSIYIASGPSEDGDVMFFRLHQSRNSIKDQKSYSTDEAHCFERQLHIDEAEATSAYIRLVGR